MRWMTRAYGETQGANMKENPRLKKDANHRHVRRVVEDMREKTIENGALICGGRRGSASRQDSRP